MESRSHKRIRVLQACEPCRSKKGKCDGQQPVCKTCKNLGIDCTYDPNPKKRGLRPGQCSSLERRALLLELLTAYLMARTPDAEETVRSFFCKQPDFSFLEPGARRTELDELFNRWKQGPISQWLFQTASATDPTLDRLSRFRSSQEPGPRLAKVTGTDPPHTRAINEGRSQATQNDEIAMGNSSSNATSTLRLPHETEDLFEIYFAFTHTWLPLIDKFKITAFARSLASSPSSSELGASQSANLSLIWAMIAYASLHAPESYWAKDSDNPKMTPIVAAKHALVLLPGYDAKFEHEHVQALILLALFHFEYGSQDVSWLLIGLAGRAAVDLSTLNPNQHLSSISRRTSLACFVVEGIIAAALNRKSQLPSLYSGATEGMKDTLAGNICQLEEEGWEEWSSWEMPSCSDTAMRSSAPSRKDPFRVLSTFNQAVQLVEILNKTTLCPGLLTGTNPPGTAVQDIHGGPPQLAAWVQRISDSHPFLAPQNLTRQPSLQIINLYCIYWIIRCLVSQRPNITGHDREHCEEDPRKIASAVSDLAMKYQSAYPASSAPFALVVSITTALTLLSANDPLSRSLWKVLSAIRQNWKTRIESDETNPSRQIADLEATSARISETRQTFHQNPGYSFHTLSDHRVLGRNYHGIHVSRQPTSNITAMNLSNTLEVDMAGADPDETASLSARDLTSLDAAVWDDELFTRNLGFIHDSQSALDLDLNHIFDPPT
ncbi:hypothetical protein ABOM_007870 [Aspergillus bombycis]|uniref:Zn(2)-C6 fungal-type domain-containing protein n=1 Tax=Aspergillus bombycis TaxID=109264 RepID=A0A1F7ZSA0_9EURO|nr:hypothetical protein ABOM_007870 [Aspergillus bombycis]OGM42340.1 hypothetical protein ABOM_007870 [Aspergillus bombycis]